jgi:hypothetical protein
MTQEDMALVAGQLADLTQAVKDMADQLISIRESARIRSKSASNAARELTEVSSRLRAAADALRPSL